MKHTIEAVNNPATIALLRILKDTLKSNSTHLRLIDWRAYVVDGVPTVEFKIEAWAHQEVADGGDRQRERRQKYGFFEVDSAIAAPLPDEYLAPLVPVASDAESGV